MIFGQSARPAVIHDFMSTLASIRLHPCRDDADLYLACRQIGFDDGGQHHHRLLRKIFAQDSADLIKFIDRQIHTAGDARQYRRCVVKPTAGGLAPLSLFRGSPSPAGFRSRRNSHGRHGLPAMPENGAGSPKQRGGPLKVILNLVNRVAAVSIVHNTSFIRSPIVVAETDRLKAVV